MVVSPDAQAATSTARWQMALSGGTLSDPWIPAARVTSMSMDGIKNPPLRGTVRSQSRANDQALQRSDGISLSNAVLARLRQDRSGGELVVHFLHLDLPQDFIAAHHLKLLPDREAVALA